MKRLSILLIVSLVSLLVCQSCEPSEEDLIQLGYPSVTTYSISSVTQTSAICIGNVTSDGGAAVTAKGVCWSYATGSL